MAYPSSHVPAGGGVYNPVSGVTATYGRNALGQLFNLSIAGQTVVSSAYYNATGQQQQMTWDGWTGDHWFNNAGQMWKQQIRDDASNPWPPGQSRQEQHLVGRLSRTAPKQRWQMPS